VIGGLLLNIGAYLTFRGKIYEAVIIYLFADLCWIIMAYQRDDFLGVLSIIIGVTFGFLAFLKMHSGDMKKSLNRDRDDI
jgi:xanthine/uracil permease